MRSFLQFLNEDRKQKTLDWLKANTHQSPVTHENIMHTHQQITPTGLDNHDSYLWFHVRNDIENDPKDAPVPIHHHVIDRLSELDPSPDKVHTQQIHKWWVKRDIRYEDAPRVNEALKTFSDNKKKLGNTTTASGKKGSDIGAYDSFHDLEDHLQQHIHGPKAAEENKGVFSHPDAVKVHDKDGYIIHELKSKAASKATRYPSCGGRPNKWCTARPETPEEHTLAKETYHAGNEGQNLHDRYSKNLYHVQTPDGKRWQFHPSSNQFADENDRMHKPEELGKQYPGLKEFKPLSDYAVKQTHGMGVDYPFKTEHEKQTMAQQIVDGAKHKGRPSLGSGSAEGYKNAWTLSKWGNKNHLELIRDTLQNKGSYRTAEDDRILGHTQYRLHAEHGIEPQENPHKPGTPEHLEGLLNSWTKARNVHDDFENGIDGTSAGNTRDWAHSQMEHANSEYVKHYGHMATASHRDIDVSGKSGDAHIGLLADWNRHGRENKKRAQVFFRLHQDSQT